MLGAGTLVAPMRRGGGTLDLSGEDRILALLAVAFAAPVNPAVLAKLRRAAELWAQGDKCLAQIHIEHLRLPKLDSEEQAFRLFLADRLIASGYSPRELCGALGFDLPEGFSNFFENAFVKRVKRRLCILIVRFARSAYEVEIWHGSKLPSIRSFLQPMHSAGL